MALVPVFIVFFYLGQGGEQVYSIIAFLVFLIASGTDALDGHIARKRNLITNFGKLMDPLADKVLTTAAFIVFVDVGIMPAWMVIVILAREFTITGLRGVAASEGVVIAAELSGKLKTVFQMVAIIVLLLAISIGETPSAYSVDFSFSGIGVILIWIAVALTVYSGIEYLWKGRKLLNMK
jgi:CDP-diacylglycerol--glycerol-3-phosphate 3-phosphatidyltransferase/cardiolipin synthase